MNNTAVYSVDDNIHFYINLVVFLANPQIMVVSENTQINIGKITFTFIQ